MPAQQHGVEIDYCPNCQGVWLDRGELDKIIERVTATSFTPTTYAPPPPSHHYDKHSKGSKKMKMVSKLFDLFT